MAGSSLFGSLSGLPLGAASVTPAGLFYDPKAFNVALTRAQSLLIVVGDPAMWVLADEPWRELLQCVVDNDAYVGMRGLRLPAQCKKRPLAALGLR